MRNYVIFKDQKDKEEICNRLTKDGYSFSNHEGDILSFVNVNGAKGISVDRESKIVSYSTSCEVYSTFSDRYKQDEDFFRPNKSKKKWFVIGGLIVVGGLIINKFRG